MAKKSFKSNVVGADKLFSINDTKDIENTRNTKDTEDTRNLKTKEYYRLNLKLDIELKEYIQEIAWLSRMSVTEYLNNLIKIDKENNKNLKKLKHNIDTRDTKNT